jgi:hypothetical protein
VISEGKKLTSFAGANQVVFNEATKAMLEAQGAAMDYQFQSLGIYAMDDGHQEELFRLFFRKNPL